MNKAVAADGMGCASFMQGLAGLRSWPLSAAGSVPACTERSNSYLAIQLSRTDTELH